MRAPFVLALVACGSRTALPEGARDAARPEDAISACNQHAAAALVLWLDATTGIEVDASGRVASWQDRSGRLANAAQTVAARRPWARKGGVYFDGAESALDLAPGFEDFTSGLSLFFVVTPEPTPYLHATRFLELGKVFGALDDTILFARWSTPTHDFFYQPYDGARAPAPVSGVLTDDAPQDLEVIAQGGCPGAATIASVYRNGVLATTAPTIVPTRVTRRASFIGRSTLSDRRGSLGEPSIDSYLKGTVAEVRLYDGALGDDARRSIEAELAAKWRL